MRRMINFQISENHTDMVFITQGTLAAQIE